ncbi:hypothetical protein ACIRPU_24905 [Streptomyces sp. NPDC102259]|uniref:hypothetical protein n=1 Tax=Streptomyces sp. NPDC102259 TaxID=3366148 RepID=UPI0038074FFC
MNLIARSAAVVLVVMAASMGVAASAAATPAITVQADAAQVTESTGGDNIWG